MNCVYGCKVAGNCEIVTNKLAEQLNLVMIDPLLHYRTCQEEKKVPSVKHVT